MSVTTIAAAAQTDRGRRRAENQDALLCEVAPDGRMGIFAVADGMGGQKAGEVASAIAIETLREDLLPLLDMAGSEGGDASGVSVSSAPDVPLTSYVRAAIARCNERILDHAQEHPETRGMGSTLTLALVKGSLAIIANVGDSRTYRVRGGAIESLTHDHSLVAQLVAMGEIAPDEIYTHPQRNFIFRALGAESEVQPDIFTERLHSGDTLLLCSDGLWDMVRDDAIYRAIGAVEGLEQAATGLVALANDNGGDDNISVIIARAS